MWYVRGESKFSDHRPVSSQFSVQVDKTIKKKTTNAVCPSIGLPNVALSSACAAAAAKVQAEELLLLPTRAQSCIDTAPRFRH